MILVILLDLKSLVLLKLQIVLKLGSERELEFTEVYVAWTVHVFSLKIGTRC